MSKQNWIEIYKFHVFYVTFVAIKLSSLFQYFSSYNTSCSYENNFWKNSCSYSYFRGGPLLCVAIIAKLIQQITHQITSVSLGQNDLIIFVIWAG